jgi:hypothetical protein
MIRTKLKTKSMSLGELQFLQSMPWLCSDLQLSHFMALEQRQVERADHETAGLMIALGVKKANILGLSVESFVGMRPARLDKVARPCSYWHGGCPSAS